MSQQPAPLVPLQWPWRWGLPHCRMWAVLLQCLQQLVPWLEWAALV